MKNMFIYLFLTIASLNMYGQNQDFHFNRYKIHKNWDYQQKAHFKIKETKIILQKGWTITETIAGIPVQRTLQENDTIITFVDSLLTITSNWKVGEVKHTSDSPGKLVINPYHFKEDADKHLNHSFYLDIPENSRIILTHSYVRVNAITIPFAIRPSLNDSIGSKITTDLKIGASVSYNYNWEKFKNRRIEAQKSVYGISTGIGFGFSKVTLDASSTSLANEPYSISQDGLAFFITPGIGLNVKGFQIVGFYGWDIGITNNVEDWNYNKKGYLGLGLGVDLSTLGKL